MGLAGASEAQVTEAWMRFRARAGGPVEKSLTFCDGQVIDAGVALCHQAIVIELPVFVTIGSEPLAAVITPLIGKANRNPVTIVAPQLLDQAIVQLAGPFALQKAANGIASFEEFGAITPLAVGGIGQGDFLRITSVPGIFCSTNFLACRFCSKGR